MRLFVDTIHFLQGHGIVIGCVMKAPLSPSPQIAVVASTWQQQWCCGYKTCRWCNNRLGTWCTSQMFCIQHKADDTLSWPGHLRGTDDGTHTVTQAVKQREGVRGGERE